MRLFITLLVSLAAGFSGSAIWHFSGLGDSATRDYLLSHPEVLPEAMQVLQQRDLASRIDPVRSELEQPFPGAVLGNPNGAITLVEFSDYSCSFCRKSVEDVERLIATNPNLKVVMREYPILRAESVDAARMALAAAEQGKFAAFHKAMFDMGPPDAATIAAAAKAAGVNLELAEQAIASGKYDNQLRSNAMLAERMGLTGTPAFIVGNEVLNGAVGFTAMNEAIGRASSAAAAKS